MITYTADSDRRITEEKELIKALDAMVNKKCKEVVQVTYGYYNGKNKT